MTVMVSIIKFLSDIVSGVATAIIETVFDAIRGLLFHERKTEYDADFLPVSVLSKSDKGFCLTGERSMSIQESYKNSLVIGSTGNYKSSGILIPSILKMRGSSSLVITDFSGELLQKTSGALLEAGYTIKVLNYAIPQQSEGYNPLQRAQSISDIQKLSKMAVINALGTGSKDPFWNMSSEQLISCMARLVKGYYPTEYHTLYTVYNLLSVLAFAPEKIDMLVVKTNDQALITEAKAFATYSDKMLTSIIATCRSALSVFGTDPSVALCTSYDTIDFSEFRKQKQVLYITTNTKDMRYYSVITSLFLEQFFGEVMSQLPIKSDLPIFFLIDEASSLYFNNLQITVANIRKYNAGILQVYQSAAQLVDLYGAPIAKALTENSYAKVYMSGQSIQVAQELESTLGKFEYEDEKGKHVRSLMTAWEIRQTNSALIFLGNKKVIKTSIVPYFKQNKLLKLSQFAPYLPENKLPYTTPPQLPID